MGRHRSTLLNHGTECCEHQKTDREITEDRSWHSGKLARACVSERAMYVSQTDAPRVAALSRVARQVVWHAQQVAKHCGRELR